MTAGIMDEGQGSAHGLVRGGIQMSDHVLADTPGQLMPGEFSRGCAAAWKLPCDEAGRLLSHSLILLLLLVQLALESDSASVAKRFVAIGVVPPHWSLSCATLRALLRSTVHVTFCVAK